METTSLIFSNNPLKSLTAIEFARALPYNRKLHILELKNVNLSNDANTALAHAYATSAMLYTVHVGVTLFTRKQINNLELAS
jgi:hypothetical protein